MALDSVEKPVMMMTGRSGLDALDLADQRQAVHARHLQVGNQQVVVPARAHTVERARSRRPRCRRRTPPAPASSTAGRGCSPRRPRRARGAGAGRGCRGGCAGGDSPRALAVEPGVDVALAEPPLAADADGGNLSRLDQAVDRAEVDLEVLEHLFGRQEHFVVG